MRVGRRGVFATAFGLAMGMSIVLSACGGNNGANSSSLHAATSSSTTSTTLDPNSAAVLKAYRAEWAAFEHALASANAYDSELPATMVNPQLQHVRASLLGDQNPGIVGRGTFALHPKITSITATTATVIDCTYSSSKLVYAKTGNPVPPVTSPEHDGVQATLVLSGSTWKVSKQDVTDGTCASGS
jgi:hypothetical protein